MYVSSNPRQTSDPHCPSNRKYAIWNALTSTILSTSNIEPTGPAGKDKSWLWFLSLIYAYVLSIKDGITFWRVWTSWYFLWPRFECPSSLILQSIGVHGHHRTVEEITIYAARAEHSDNSTVYHSNSHFKAAIPQCSNRFEIIVHSPKITALKAICTAPYEQWTIFFEVLCGPWLQQ